jgi:hypothetical protein
LLHEKSQKTKWVVTGPRPRYAGTAAHRTHCPAASAIARPRHRARLAVIISARTEVHVTYSLAAMLVGGFSIVVGIILILLQRRETPQAGAVLIVLGGLLVVATAIAQ